MRTTLRRLSTATALVVLACSSAPAADGPGPVTVLRTPDGGIQPQAAIDAEGAIHLIFFKGEPAGGDLFYSRLARGRSEFSAPVRVNSLPGTAVATGTIRGGQVALGKGGRVHVAWNGSIKPRAAGSPVASPMWYARSNPERTAFEPQRDLMTRTSGLDGGGSVAADSLGNVYVAWHGRTADAPPREQGRQLFLARSRDEGATFAAEEPATDRPTGACGCCGCRAFADRAGDVFILYRGANREVERDMLLLTSRDRGEHFLVTSVHPWRINACPMSSASMTEGADAVTAAWETRGEVHFARIDPKTGTAGPTIRPPGTGGRKHPAVAVNARGETLLAWAEGTVWQKGGTLVWRVFDPSGRPTGESGRIDRGIPVWSLPTAIARPDGGFVIVH
jgi:hypothetical protein